MTAQPQIYYHFFLDLCYRLQGVLEAMVYSWQLWLSPRPTQRTKIVQDAFFLANEGAILYEFPVYQGHRAVRETHYIGHKSVREGRSGPPLHIHLRQKETFEVEQDVLGVVQNGVESAIRKADGPVSIEPGVRHRFWSHASATEDLIFKVWVQPEDLDNGFDEAFMRNFGGYLSDCNKHKMAPSIFQILLFSYHAGLVLTPPFWLPIWLLTGLHHVLAYWVGAALLGYKASYREYSNHGK